MITALCPSPALDVTYVVDDFVLGEIHRPGSVTRVAGGKALNAARAAATVGVDVAAVALLGGSLGDAVERAAESHGVRITRVDTAAETRSCVSVLSLAGSVLTEVYEHPSAVSAAEWETALATVAAALGERPGWLMVSGGMPSGLGADALARVLALAARAGVAVALDSHGPALRAAVGRGGAASARSGPVLALLKINRAEAAELLDVAVNSPLIELARGVRALTRGMVVVTDGVGGAIGIDSEGSALHASIPQNAGAFPVGSGDSFLGALVVAIDGGESFESALRWATAAATANAGSAGAARFKRAQAEQLRDAVKIIPIQARV